VNILDRLERHLGPFAIPGLIRYVVALNALVWILGVLQPSYLEMLMLDRAAILRGEVWRIVSWIFIPTTTSLLWIVFYLLFTWWTGDLIEGAWGTFKLNAYYFTGMVACIVAAMVFGTSGGNVFLNLTLLLAAATLAPNLEILIFFIIPLKLKWVGVISLVFPALAFLAGPNAVRAIIVVCMANYLLFFGPQFLRTARQNRSAIQRRQKFQQASFAESSLHRCAACGITEVTDPSADFRVAADGNEYCTKHLPS
jgi:hypothetical protein